MTNVEEISAALDEAQRTAEQATRGPWHWTEHRVPDLIGRSGEPGVYEWDIEVLQAEHYGECGCRSACELELTIRDEDRAHIARHADPAHVLRLIAKDRGELERATQTLALHRHGEHGWFCVRDGYVHPCPDHGAALASLAALADVWLDRKETTDG